VEISNPLSRIGHCLCVYREKLILLGGSNRENVAHVLDVSQCCGVPITQPDHGEAKLPLDSLAPSIADIASQLEPGLEISTNPTVGQNASPETSSFQECHSRPRNPLKDALVRVCRENCGELMETEKF
jgi:hypothetical protein